METLIIRIYRRNPSEPEGIAGLIETVGSDEKRTFQSFSGMITAIEGVVFGREGQDGETTERDTYLTSGKKQAG